MGLHSTSKHPGQFDLNLGAVTAEEVAHHGGWVQARLARIVAHVDAHHAQESPLHGYRQAEAIASEIARNTERLMEGETTDSPPWVTLSVLLWDVCMLQSALLAYRPRNDIKRVVADVRRSAAAAQKDGV